MRCALPGAGASRPNTVNATPARNVILNSVLANAACTRPEGRQIWFLPPQRSTAEVHDERSPLMAALRVCPELAPSRLPPRVEHELVRRLPSDKGCRMAAAVQLNTSDDALIKRSLKAVLDDVAKAALQ